MSKENYSKTQRKSSPIFKKLKIFSHSLDNYNKHENLEFVESTESADSTKRPISTPETNNSVTDFSNENRLQNKNILNKFVVSKDVLETTKIPERPRLSFISSALNGYSKIQELKLVKIGLASSDKIVNWAEKILPNGKIFGEVLNANTLHYKTFKPHKGGLFCERIFGPLKDFECACGIKQKPFQGESYNVQSLLEPKQSKRLFCPVCDVEYTWSVIRRYQLGYIRLVSPVSHLWYLRTNPSYLSLLLDIRKRNLESIIYCMQITTLEYYWRPIYSLQMNLTPSSLFNSYKQFFKLNFENVENQKFLQMKLTKRQKEYEKRKQSPASTKIFVLFNPLEKLKSLENESLKIKIQYLEKSFQLSSDEVYSSIYRKTLALHAFFQKKLSIKIKKNSFTTVYKKIFKRFYQEIYLLVSRRSFRSLYKTTKDYSDLNFNSSCPQENGKGFPIIKLQKSIKSDVKLRNTNHLDNKILKVKTSSSFLSLTLKTYLQKTSEKKGPKGETTFVNALAKVKRAIICNKIKTTPPKVFFDGRCQIHYFIKNNKQRFFSYSSKEKSDFLNNFLGQFVLRKTEIQQSWKSIYKKQQNAIFLLNTCYNLSVYKRTNASEYFRSSKTVLPSNTNFSYNQILENIYFLYILWSIQENSNFDFEKKSISYKNLNLLNFILKQDSNSLLKVSSRSEESVARVINPFKVSPDVKKLDSHVSFVQPNSFFLDEAGKLLKIDNIDNFWNTPENNFILFLNIWLNKITTFFIKISYYQNFKKYLKTNQDRFKVCFFETNPPIDLNLSTAHPLHTSEFFKSKNQSKQVLFQQTKQLNKCLFKKLNQQKKFIQFLKIDQYYTSNYVIYSKNLVQMAKKLSVQKQKTMPSAFNLFNNIYTVGYSSGWETDKDWRYFLFYNTAPIEIQDQLLYCYKYRFISYSLLNHSFSTSIPIIGANLIQKLLYQYEGFELKKMSKQHQNLLPKLNRHIRNLKQIAQKKSEFLEIQKLLQKRDQIIRRLKLLRKVFKKNSKASSIVLNTLPVLPPDLRPILKMQNQIAASDLNRFYQRILYRNERLKKFLKANSSMINYEPGFEMKYAQRLLQEAVDNLIQNGKGHVKPETNSRGQPLKSLSEILKGKQGRFRQYLLGKRVDYSGRSVIVVGPRLKIYQCGLPFEMAMELFLPFLIKRIFQYRLARTVVGAKTILKTQRKITWNLLEEVMQNHPVLLNRAPTLHRLGIQAFQPKLIEGRAILLHPLVCPAFNADFDGDQMAVHLPITVEARTEAWKLMFSRNHLISPATGEPMLLPSQDMVLGCYYLTTESLQNSTFHQGRPFISGTHFYFSNMPQVLQAYVQQKIHLQTPIWIKWNGLLEMEHYFSQPLEIRLSLEGSWTELRPKTHKRLNSNGLCQAFFVRTTAGRILFNTIIENCILN